METNRVDLGKTEKIWVKPKLDQPGVEIYSCFQTPNASKFWAPIPYSLVTISQECPQAEMIKLSKIPISKDFDLGQSEIIDISEHKIWTPKYPEDVPIPLIKTRYLVVHEALNKFADYIYQNGTEADSPVEFIKQIEPEGSHYIFPAF